MVLTGREVPHWELFAECRAGLRNDSRVHLEMGLLTSHHLFLAQFILISSEKRGFHCIY